MKQIFYLIRFLILAACRHGSITDVSLPVAADSPKIVVPLYPRVDTFDGMYQQHEVGYLNGSGTERFF